MPILLFYTLFSSLFFLVYADSRGERVEFQLFYLPLGYPTFFYASFCRVGRFRFRGDNGVGFRTNKVYEKNTLRTKYGRKIFIRTACGSALFVREEPVNTFAHVTKMTDAIECIISQMEVNE